MIPLLYVSSKFGSQVLHFLAYYDPHAPMSFTCLIEEVNPLNVCSCRK